MNNNLNNQENKKLFYSLKDMYEAENPFFEGQIYKIIDTI